MQHGHAHLPMKFLAFGKLELSFFSLKIFSEDSGLFKIYSIASSKLFFFSFRALIHASLLNPMVINVFNDSSLTLTSDTFGLK